MKNKKQPLSKTARTLLIILFIISACVLAFCAYKIFSIKQGYKEAENYYSSFEKMLESGAVEKKARDDAAGQIVNPENADSTVSDIQGQQNAQDVQGQQDIQSAQTAQQDDTGAAQDQKTGDDYQTAKRSLAYSMLSSVPLVKGYDYSKIPPMKKNFFANPNWMKEASIYWDFDVLHDMCSDAVGYIYQEKTMSYPVVQAEDNDKYLRSFIDGSYSVSGTIFVDYHFPEGLNSRYAIVYGHNMDDKSMFGSITAYKDEAYCREHPYFEIYTEDGMYAYYVYAAGQVSIDDYIFTVGLDDEKFLEQMDKIKELRTYDPECPVKIDKDSKVLILSTCIDYPRDYNYRYIVAIVRGEPLLEKETAE